MNLPKIIFGFLGGLFLGLLVFKIYQGPGIANLFKNTFSGEKTFVEEISLGKFEASLVSQNKTSRSGEKTAPAETFCSFQTSASKEIGPVVLNEIAWMGNDENFNNEWLELKNISRAAVDISGWQLLDKDGQIKVVFPEIELKSEAFILLERGEAAVPEVTADIIYVGNLRNSDEVLSLFDSQCNLIDEVVANPDWPAGESGRKLTMERDEKFNWYTSSVAGGTPKKVNSPRLEEKIILTNYSLPAAVTETATTSPPAPPEISPLPPPEAPPQVLISEVMAGVDGNAKYEFIELYNLGEKPVALTGWNLKKQASTGNESSIVVAKYFEGKIIAPGSYFLLVNSGGVSGGPEPDIAWPSSYTIAYTNNAVLLYNAAGEVADSVNWTEIPEGKSFTRAAWNSKVFNIEGTPTPQGTK